MKTYKLNKPMCSVVLGLLMSHAAQATIIDHDSYLTDTASGLDWLDVTATVNMSIDQVSAQLGVGGLYDGWRFASADQFNVLVGNYTGNSINTYGEVIQEPDLIDGLVTMLGSTYDSAWVARFGKTWDAYNGYVEGEGFDYTKGYIFDSHLGSHYVAMISDYDIDNLNPDFSWAKYSLEGIAPYEDAGSFLVRDSQMAQVPEPSTMALLGLGFLIVAGRRMKPQA